MTTQHKLSTSGKLAVVIGLAYATPVFAANIEAIQGGAQVSQHNGVDIVNIVKPNEQGLSHNQYNKYDVSQAGAVLNNALQAGQSQLAGQLGANSNFNGKAAEVILNEVVSKNPSLILGQQEVFGMAADYVLANPNGITYNGGHIINAPRASLVVGTPEVVNGKLDNFNTNNANVLNITGKVGGVSILDLVAPKVIANAESQLSADQTINVVSGANKVGYTSGKIEKLEREGNVPVLDGQIFGSMNAGTIRIHATDERATQTIKNAQVTASKELTTDIAGNLNITATNVSSGDIRLNAQNTLIDGDIQQTGSNVPQVSSGKLEKNVRFTKQTTQSTEDFKGSKIAATGALELNNTGDLELSGVDLSAGSLKVNAQNVAANSVITTNASSEVYRRSKGLWHNQTTTASQDQTIHTSNIHVKGDAHIHADQALTLNGANLAIDKDMVLSGTQSINLSGTTATDRSEHGLDIRNEGIKLQTGKSAQAEVTQTYAATQINVGGNLGLQTQGSFDSQGAHIAIKGDAIIDAEHVDLRTTTTQTSNAASSQFKYWGGLAGGKEDGKTYTQEHLQASSLVTEGHLLIGAKNGVNVSGSTVKGGTGALVNAGDGALNITNAVTNTSTSEKTRTGTIFNITKNRSSKTSDVEVVTGATLASDTNLQLVSQDDVNVLGSTFKVADHLGIKTAGHLNIGTAKANSHTTENDFAIKTFAEGYANATAQNGAVTAEVNGGLGLRFIRSGNDTQSTDQVGSSLNAGSIDLTAEQDANISGSEVKASGDVNVNAQNVTVTAAQDVKVSKDTSRVTELGLSTTVSTTGYNPSVSAKLGLSSEYESTTTTNGTAQVSNITGANVNVTAQNNITHEGTHINATNGNITQSAENITNDVANNTSNVNKTHSAGGIFISAGASQSSGVSVSAGIYGKGGSEKGHSNTAVTGSLNASNDVNQTAHTVTDVATHYDAGQGVNITAEQYTNQAAANDSTYTTHQGGASLTVSANTKDLTNINVNAGLNVDYDHSNTQTSKATLGNMNADHINITSKEDVNFASNIKTDGDVNITSTAGDVTLTQANNTESTTKAGVDVAVNVGAKVNAATGVTLPKVGAGVEVTYANANSSTGTAGVITSHGDVNVTANDQGSINVNGASIISKGDIKLTAGEVNSHALTHTHDSLNVSTGGRFSLGTGMVGDNQNKSLSLDSAGVGAHADVSKETGVSHTNNQIIAQNDGATNGLNINATNQDGKGITLTGTNVIASTANLTAAGGNVDLTSAEGSLKRTGGGAGFGIDGGVSSGFKPTSGNAHINVDVTNNQTYTGSDVKANHVNINSSGDLNLNSSTITATNMTATVAGDVNVKAQQNVVDETKVDLAASGSKGTDLKSLTTTEKATNQALSDLQNGTILGTKAEAKLDVHTDDRKTSQDAGITANHLDVKAGGDINLVGATVQYKNGTGFGDSTVTTTHNQDSSETTDLTVNVSTNVPEMTSYGIKHVTTGTSPLFNANTNSTQTVVMGNVSKL